MKRLGIHRDWNLLSIGSSMEYTKAICALSVGIDNLVSGEACELT